MFGVDSTIFNSVLFSPFVYPFCYGTAGFCLFFLLMFIEVFNQGANCPLIVHFW